VATTSTDKVVGGYASVNWTGVSSCGYKVDSEAFLFSLTNDFRHVATGSNTTTGLYDCSSDGPTFGGGWDLRVTNGMGTTNLGYTYSCRVGASGSGDCLEDFAGVRSLSDKFTYTELEVFYLQ
jgi:hypothetical protein